MMQLENQSGAGGGGQDARFAAIGERFGEAPIRLASPVSAANAPGQAPCPLPPAPLFAFPLHTRVRA
jgi:hypothetical protein